MELPANDNLPINLLASCFNYKSTTYKFYWLISILELVEKGRLNIQKKELFSKMISNAWYTINYFQVSFGVQDQFQNAILELKKEEDLKINDKKEIIEKILIQTENQKSLRILNHFDINVPHKFLSPWFPKNDKSNVYHFSESFENNCPYALYKNHIIINPDWIDYLQRNSKILKDFCFWNLTLFLQSRNPNVPDIPNKLIKAPQRGNLIQQRNNFWNLVFEEKGTIECIYTGKALTIDNYAVDHFVPHNFVSHDLVWNLIPSDIPYNIFKSNKLPQLDKYFEPFFQLQKEALEIVSVKTPRNKFLEAYLTIFPEVKEVKNLPNYLDKGKYKELLQPLISIASNNGFQYLP